MGCRRNLAALITTGFVSVACSASPPPKQGQADLETAITSAGFGFDEPVATIFSGAKDPVPRILSAPEYIPPGTTNYYSSRSAHLVTAVLLEALNRADGDDPRTVLGYAIQKLFTPLGIKTEPAFTGRATVGDPAFDSRTDFGWGTDAAGLNSGCCLLRLTPADVTKIGELFRSGGVWRGTRILPAGWAAECTPRGGSVLTSACSGTPPLCEDERCG